MRWLNVSSAGDADLRRKIENTRPTLNETEPQANDSSWLVVTHTRATISLERALVSPVSGGPANFNVRRQKRPQSSHESQNISLGEFVLPDAHNRPSLRTKETVHFAITRLAADQLCRPKWAGEKLTKKCYPPFSLPLRPYHGDARLRNSIAAWRFVRAFASYRRRNGSVWNTEGL